MSTDELGQNQGHGTRVMLLVPRKYITPTLRRQQRLSGNPRGLYPVKTGTAICPVTVAARLTGWYYVTVLRVTFIFGCCPDSGKPAPSSGQRTEGKASGSSVVSGPVKYGYRAPSCCVGEENQTIWYAGRIFAGYASGPDDCRTRSGRTSHCR